MKRKQNSAEKVKRKLTVWQYQYDNGEAGMLHERKGVWRGEKRIWSDIAYFPNENEAQKHVKDLCRKNGISEEKCMRDSRTYPDQRQDIGTGVAVRWMGRYGRAGTDPRLPVADDGCFILQG